MIHVKAVYEKDKLVVSEMKEILPNANAATLRNVTPIYPRIIALSPERYKPKLIWDNNKELASIRVGTYTYIKVSLCSRNGIKSIQLSKAFYDEKRHRFIYRRNSIHFALAVPIEKGTGIVHPLEDFIKVFAIACEEIKDFKLQDKDHTVYARGAATYENRKLRGKQIVQYPVGGPDGDSKRD